MLEIARTIIPILPHDKEPFWVETEQGILAAALLYYFTLGLSFSESVCQIVGTTVSALCKELSKSDDSRVQMLLGEITDMKPETLASIDRGLRNKLMLFATDPYISHAFRGQREGASCFTWDDLRTHNIFLRIPPERIEQWGSAINLMYSQLMRYLERRPEKYSAEGADNIQTLLLMDEFAQFGKPEMTTSAMATLRSKSVNICLIIQSVAQPDRIYGTHERSIIIDNCQYQAILRANDVDTQEYLCKLIGTRIYQQHSAGENLDEFMKTTGYSKQIGEVREWAVHLHELSTLKDILLLTPDGFCRVEKLRPHHALENPFPVENTEHLTASVDDPMIFYENISIKNEGATMLTINERVQNANKRAAESQHQQRLKQR